MAVTKRGLTLGKFAPLHEGHQMLIETALAEMDEVVVIVYDCPETTTVPLSVRADWVRGLYPEARVIEAWDGPTEVGDTPEIRKRHEDYVLDRLEISDISHFYSGEFYGKHMSEALGAVNRIVDPGRETVPISGTQVRGNPFAYREYLDPRVYRDLVTNVVFLGAPSTGKTTISARLAREYGTVWMPEYGREYWERHQVCLRLTPEGLVEIAEEHLRCEEVLLFEADRYLFTDTNALTTYVFSLYYHGLAAPRLERLADEAASRYDLVFVCGAVPYHDTRDRSGEANRRVFQKRVLADLASRKIPYFVLRGGIEERVNRVKSVLNPYVKYANIMDVLLPDAKPL
ncbi:MAG: AAA family ATPase [Rubrobacteraceae bacterium]|nr:AAA family ATPase [Rubrobacteraceae bacterium]